MNKVFQSDEIIEDRQLDVQTLSHTRPQAEKKKNSREGVQLSGAHIFDYSLSETKSTPAHHTESSQTTNSVPTQTVSQNAKKGNFNFGYAHSINTAINITGVKINATDSTNYILASTSNSVLNTKTRNDAPTLSTPDAEIVNSHQEKNITKANSEESDHYAFNDTSTFITPFSAVKHTETPPPMTSMESKKSDIFSNTKEPSQSPVLEKSPSHTRAQSRPLTKSEGFSLGGLDNSIYALGQVSPSKNNIQDTPKITRNPLFDDPTQTQQQESKKTVLTSHAIFNTHTTPFSTHKVIGNPGVNRTTQIKLSSLDTPRVQLQTNTSLSEKNKGVSGFKYENRLLCYFDEETSMPKNKA
jgi:hypothetical protein